MKDHMEQAKAFSADIILDAPTPTCQPPDRRVSPFKTTQPQKNLQSAETSQAGPNRKTQPANLRNHKVIK